MRRLITLIVLIFAFASVAGTSVAHAHRYISTPIVVLNHVDENNRSIPVVVAVQRGEIDLGDGIMLPCGAHHGIEVSGPQLPLSASEASLIASVNEDVPVSVGMRMLRPPKQA